MRAPADVSIWVSPKTSPKQDLLVQIVYLRDDPRKQESGRKESETEKEENPLNVCVTKVPATGNKDSVARGQEVGAMISKAYKCPRTACLNWGCLQGS